MWKNAREHASFEFVSWMGDIMIAIIEAVVAILVYVWDPLCIKKLPFTDPLVIALVAYLIYFLILLFFTYIGLLLRNYASLCKKGYIKATDPFIKVKETGLFNSPIYVWHKDKKGKEVIDKEIMVEFIYIHLVNDPKSIIVDSLAKDLTAVITYTDKNNQKLFPSFFGVWADKPSQSRLKPGEQARDLLFTNLPPGELGQKLNIGFQEQGKRYYYAFNQESANYRLYKNPNLKIKNREVHVEINIKGSKIARLVKFKITNDKGKIKIIQLDKPKWENNDC